MPRKKNPSKTYGQKIIHLFAEMLFSNEKRSLSELAKMLDCSKQTVSRIIDDITLAYSIQIEVSFQGQQKYFRVKRPKSVLPVNLSESELSILQMCHAFTEHLLGKQLFDQAARAIEKNKSQLPESSIISSKHFANKIPGNIDYAGYHQIILDLISAMEARKVCRVRYKKISVSKAKSFYIKPLKIFSHKDTIYLHAKMAMYPGGRYKEPQFDPLLAIHRIEGLEITNTSYEFPDNYNFEKAFNQHFGVMNEGVQKVTIEFSGWAAGYVSERNWSTDQEIINKKDGNVILTFTTSSEPELITWILSFGNEAKVLEPARLIKEIKKNITAMQAIYE